MFDRPVSKRDVARYRKTGAVPEPKSTEPKTDLEKIQALMVRATTDMRSASYKISDITALMSDSNITDAKGRSREKRTAGRRIQRSNAGNGRCNGATG
jgi:hypothetical protein